MQGHVECTPQRRDDFPRAEACNPCWHLWKVDLVPSLYLGPPHSESRATLGLQLLMPRSHNPWWPREPFSCTAISPDAQGLCEAPQTTLGLPLATILEDTPGPGPSPQARHRLRGREQSHLSLFISTPWPGCGPGGPGTQALAGNSPTSPLFSEASPLPLFSLSFHYPPWWGWGWG